MDSLYRPLQEIIEERIRSVGGLISYAKFMQFALYHEHGGYYMREAVKIGRQGDFLTTSNIGDVYGKMVAKWIYRLVKEQNLPVRFCEVGAGSGRFAKAFLDEWDRIADCDIEYSIVETSPYHLKLQRELLHEHVIRQINLNDLDNYQGVIYSNELFDALPVHVITMKDGELLEVMVSVGKDGAFTETMVRLENPAILSYLHSHGIALQEQQRYEIPLAMIEMLRVIAKCLSRGLVITVDYGYTNQEWKEAIHRDGSLRGYEKHRMVRNILQSPGEMDITSHIHWDAFIQAGQELGFTTEKFMRQDEFFVAIGLLKELEDHYDPNPFSDVSKRNRAIRSLIIPGGMSSHFQVLLQGKNISAFGLKSEQ